MVSPNHVRRAKRNLRIVLYVPVHGTRCNGATSKAQLRALESEPFIDWIMLVKLKKQTLSLNSYLTTKR